MLECLRLSGFKSWKDSGEVVFRPITGFFGPNSSGKTSLLQYLLLLKQTAESTDRHQVLEMGEAHTAVELGSLGEVLHDGDAEAGLQGEIQWRVAPPLELSPVTVEESSALEVKAETWRDETIRFASSIGMEASGMPFVRRLAYQFGGHEFGIHRVQQGRRLAYTLINDPGGYRFRGSRGRPSTLLPVKCYGFSDWVRSYYHADFLGDLQLAFEDLLRSIYYLGPLRVDPEREYPWSGSQPGDVGWKGEKAVGAVLASMTREQKVSLGERRIKRRKYGTLGERVGLWLKDMKMVADFEVKSISEDSNLYRVWVRKSAKSPLVPLTDVGFGVSQLLPMLVLCYYVPKGSIVLLEQPEIHLHPAVQADLADVIIDAVKTRGIQVIFESHSEHLLQRLQRRIAEDRFEANSTALHFCEIDAGVSHIVPLEMDLFGNITNWPKDFFGDPLSEAAAMAHAELERRGRGEA